MAEDAVAEVQRRLSLHKAVAHQVAAVKRLKQEFGLTQEAELAMRLLSSENLGEFLAGGPMLKAKLQEVTDPSSMIVELASALDSDVQELLHAVLSADSGSANEGSNGDAEMEDVAEQAPEDALAEAQRRLKEHRTVKGTNAVLRWKVALNLNDQVVLALRMLSPENLEELLAAEDELRKKLISNTVERRNEIMMELITALDADIENLTNTYAESSATPPAQALPKAKAKAAWPGNAVGKAGAAHSALQEAAAKAKAKAAAATPAKAMTALQEAAAKAKAKAAASAKAGAMTPLQEAAAKAKARAKAAAAAKEASATQEKRYAEDGVAYTKQEFIDELGAELAQQVWDASTPAEEETPAEAAAPEEEEKRIAEDGEAYTKQEFIDELGPDLGQQAWDAATPSKPEAPAQVAKLPKQSAKAPPQAAKATPQAAKAPPQAAKAAAIAALKALKLGPLKKKALEMGCDNGAVAEADDSDDPKQTVLDLIVARMESKAGAQPTPVKQPSAQGQDALAKAKARANVLAAGAAQEVGKEDKNGFLSKVQGKLKLMKARQGPKLVAEIERWRDQYGVAEHVEVAMRLLGPEKLVELFNSEDSLSDENAPTPEEKSATALTLVELVDPEAVYMATKLKEFQDEEETGSTGESKDPPGLKQQPPQQQKPLQRPVTRPAFQANGAGAMQNNFNSASPDNWQMWKRKLFEMAGAMASGKAMGKQARPRMG